MLKKPTLSRRRMCFIKHFNASECGNSVEAENDAVLFLQQFFISLFDYFFLTPKHVQLLHLHVPVCLNNRFLCWLLEAT